MKRKEFLRNGVIASAAGVSLLAGCNAENSKSDIPVPNIITNKKIKWKMVTTWPPNYPVVGEGCKLLSEWINKMSAGRIEIDVYGGGELVPPLEVFEAVSSGAAEIGHGSSYYWAGIQPAFQFFTAVPFGMNAQQIDSWLFSGGGLELWTELYANYNLVPFVAGNTGVQMGGWFNRRIDKMSDFNGLKMRMPGLGGTVLERAGGTAVLSPGSELYTNLERGVIDATEWIGPYHDYLMGFHQIAKYYYYPGWHETGSSLECIINKKDFDGLTPDLQEIVRTAMYRVNAYMLAEFEAKNNFYLKKIREESKVEILPFPKEVIAGLKKISMDIYRELIEKDDMAKRVYDSYWPFKKDISEWSKLSEQIFLNEVQ
jgi:TRAP-type mannitol/chloroaromatic compound transport system substrate-binding protein